jgi:hypothetical protein
MQVAHLSWHDYIVVVSFFAAIAGLILLSDPAAQEKAEEVEDVERTLVKMGFAYWLVYCIAKGILKLELPEWESLFLGLKVTGAIAYMLTFCCILSLPLNRISTRYAAKRY